MTGSDLSSAGLDARRRRILFRAWRRGTREMDLAFGQFADAELKAMNEADLAGFERLLDAAEPDVAAWILEAMAPPPEIDAQLLARLRRSARARGLA